MNILHLIKKLELAAKKSLQLADEEKEKQDHGAYFPLDGRSSRVTVRETFYRNEYAMIVAAIAALKSLDDTTDESEKEEVIFLGRKLVAEAFHPFIRRRMLDEDQYKDIYRDIHFEPYAEGLPIKKSFLLQSHVHVLGLHHDLEIELIEALRKTKPPEFRDEYVPLLHDVLVYKKELHLMFKDGWTKKARLIMFRLYELGLDEAYEKVAV